MLHQLRCLPPHFLPLIKNLLPIQGIENIKINDNPCHRGIVVLRTVQWGYLSPLSIYLVLFIKLGTKYCESRGGGITRGRMVGDREGLTAELVFELNLEVGKSLSARGEKVFWKDNRYEKE